MFKSLFRFSFPAAVIALVAGTVIGSQLDRIIPSSKATPIPVVHEIAAGISQPSDFSGIVDLQ